MRRPGAFQALPTDPHEGVEPEGSQRAMIVNQWVPAAHRGDAIGDSARRVRALLRQLGHQSELYALTVDDDLQGDIRSFDSDTARQGDVTIFHYALPSPMTEAFAALPRGRVLQYHNVTPARFFAPYDANLFRLATLGREEIARLAGRTDAALGDSEFNRHELESLGFSNYRCLSHCRRSRPHRSRGISTGSGTSPDRRVDEFPVRRPHRPQQEDRRPHPAR
jgi:hypothetical protein